MTVVARAESSPSDEATVTWQRVSTVAQLAVGSLVRELRPVVAGEDPKEFVEGFTGRIHLLGHTLVMKRDEGGRPDGDLLVERPGSLVVEFLHDGQPGGLAAFVEPELGIGDYGTVANGKPVLGSGRYLEVSVPSPHLGLPTAA